MANLAGSKGPDISDKTNKYIKHMKETAPYSRNDTYQMTYISTITQI